jgi:hypothetical protein
MKAPSNELIVSTSTARPTHRLWVAILLAALALAVLVGSALAAGNLVKNGSFEKDSDGDGIPNGWGDTGALTPLDKRVCNQSYAGSCSFKMVADGTAKGLAQLIAVAGLTGDEFKLSAWTKGKSIVDSGGPARLIVEISLGGSTSDYASFDIPDGSSPWTLHQLSLTATANYDTVTIYLYFYSTDSGKIWVDKVKLVETP